MVGRRCSAGLRARYGPTPSRAGIYAVDAEDGGDLERLTTPPAGLSDLPGDFAPDGWFVFKRYSADEGTGPQMVLPAGGASPRCS